MDEASFKVPKPVVKNGTRWKNKRTGNAMRVMASAGIWLMARYPRAMPFVLDTRDLQRDFVPDRSGAAGEE